jgi:hypothetical protein
MKHLPAVLMIVASPALAITGKPPVASPSRTITVSAASAPPEVYTGVNEGTLIAIAPGEKVATVFVGDASEWSVQTGRAPSRFIVVEPLARGLNTDLHIISDHGNPYTAVLHEVSHDHEPQFDSEVFLVAGDKAAQEHMKEAPVFVPASDLAQAKQEAAAAEAQAQAARKQAQAQMDQYERTLIQSQKFNYRWDRHKGADLGLEEIYSMGHSTYIHGDFDEPPALYAERDGKPELVNFAYSGGVYTVPEILHRGYLVIGKKRVEFHAEDK